jgi:predicted permease
VNVHLLISTFESVGLLLGVGVLGLWLIGKRILPEQALGALSTLALDIALPSLVFVNILQNFKPSKFEGWWLLPLWWAGLTLLLATLAALFSFASKRESRREFAAALFYQNGLFFPLAILTGMFGSGSPYIVDLFFFMLFYPSLVFSTAHLFFGKTEKGLSWSKIINRVLLATLIATLLRLTGAEGIVPDFVTSALRMVGEMALPLLMLILGGNMYVDFKHKGKLYPVEIAKFVVVKNFLFPLITFALLFAVRPSYHIALLMILQAAVPPVTAVPILIDRAGGNRHLVNQFMFSSFALSLISIPLMIGLFAIYYQPPSP